MRAGIGALVMAYVLSQFFRTFLAVLAPDLVRDVGATPEDLATASGLWFLAFAAMQLPVGWALDRVGPRLTTAVLLALGAGGGAFWMAWAGGPDDISVAMVMIGIGCSPVLMAAYFLFARMYSPALFGTLASVTVGIGSLGNIAASLPLAWAADALGWRGTMTVLATVSIAVALLIALLVRDPARIAGQTKGSVLDLLRMPAMWLILPIAATNYLPLGALRGLWVGPYYANVFGEGPEGIGRVALVMGLAMVAGNMLYGPAERLARSRKLPILWGNLITAAALLALALLPPGWWTGLLLLSAVGLFGTSFAMVMAHGRAFIPPHLVGRGVTLINLCALGSVGVAQFATGRLFAAIPATTPAAPFNALFLLFAGLLIVGLIPYLWAQDRTD